MYDIRLNTAAPKQRYSQELSDLRWKLKSENIRKRDNYTCRICGQRHLQLDVHHLRYVENAKAWEYDDGDLVTLCHTCHENLHERQRKKDTFRRGDYFYSTNFQGVGIVTAVDDEGVNFDVCWVENHNYIHEDHPRLYLCGFEFWDCVREPSREEIVDFWDKCCHEHPIIIEDYLLQYFEDYLYPNHPIIKGLDDYYKEMHHI